MSEERAKAQGLFVPNWWLAILLIPVLIWVYWMSTNVHDFQSAQNASLLIQAANSQAQTTAIQSLKDTVEFRLKNIETQGKLNDEHLRLMENRIARLEGRKNIQPIDPEQ